MNNFRRMHDNSGQGIHPCTRPHNENNVFCECGEVLHRPAWGWSDMKTPYATVSDDGQDVLFHNTYSKGTACIRGNTAFVDGYQYYWEMKVTRAVYGKAVMIGVGTADVDVCKYLRDFEYLLGEDENSWAMHFDGSLWHSGRRKMYNKMARFSIGTIVGIHLDLFHGTMEYFINRVKMGTAFHGLKGRGELFPYISSTAAYSSFRLTYSTIRKHSLQFILLKRINREMAQYMPPGLRILHGLCWWNFPKISVKVFNLRKGAHASPRNEIYLVFDGDETQDAEHNRVLALRMEAVLKNSLGPCAEITRQPKRFKLSNICP